MQAASPEGRALEALGGVGKLSSESGFASLLGN